MKFKNTAIVFSLILIFSIFSTSFVSSFSPLPPEYLCDERGMVYGFYSEGCGAKEEIWENVKPPTVFGGYLDKVKIAFSNDEVKLKLNAILTAEQIAKMEQALEEGNYKKAMGVAESIGKIIGESGGYLEEYAIGTELEYNEDFMNGPFRDFRNVEGRWTETMSGIDRIEDNLMAKIVLGGITKEEADKILSEMTGEAGELSVIFADRENQFINEIVEDSNGEVTKLEIDYRLKYEDKQTGFEDTYYYNNVNRDDIAFNKYTLDSLKEEIISSDKREFADVDELFMQTRIAQQNARDALIDENYRRAYENFQESEYLISVLENYNENGEKALEEINPVFDKTFEEINQEVEEENKQLVEEYKTEGVREEILENYPEYKTELDKTYDEAVIIVDVSEKINEIEEDKITSLISAGKTEEEAKAEVEELTTKEYFYADGGKEYPIGYVDFIDSDGDGVVEANYGGGFMKGIPYTDYSSHFDYVMGGNGFTITSPLTETPYLVKYPANYEPERFEKGDESFKYKYEAEDGEYEIEYLGEGMILHKPDGSSEFVSNYADVSPMVTAVGGTEFRYNSAGYDVIADGEATRWTVNPEFGVYQDLASGKKFMPEFPHYGDVVYSDGVYEYTVGETRVKFDPNTNVFKINEQTTITPPIPEAPVGLEEKALENNGEIVTEHGEKWTYNEAEAIWTSEKTNDAGEIETKEIVIAPNELYRYDAEDEEYIDVHGEEIEEAVFDDETWTLIGDAWVSESDLAYDPATGKTFTPEGEVEISEEEDGNLRNYGTVYDKNGKVLGTHTYNPEGRYIYDPTQGSTGGYTFVRWYAPDYDPATAQKYDVKDAQGNVVTTWTQDRDGRWYQPGEKGEKNYYGYEEYSQTNAFAEVGRKVNVDGREYFVDAEKGWATTDASGNVYAVGPPIGQLSSAVNMRTRGEYYGFYDDYDSRYDRNYNYVSEGNAYYFPSGIDPATLTKEQKEAYQVDRARGYDPATGTCFDYCSAGGYVSYSGYNVGSTPGVATGTTYSDNSGNVWTKSEQGDWTSSDGRTYGTPPGYSYNNYGYGSPTSYSGGTGFGNIQQADGSWKQATSQAEVDAAQLTGTYAAPGSSTTGYYSGEDYGYGYRDYSGYGSYYSSPAAATVGTTVNYEGQTYTVTAEKGWTDASGNPTGPPPGQPSSAVGSNYAGPGYTNMYGYGGTPYSSSGTGAYSGGYYGGYGMGGQYYTPSGTPTGTYATGPTGYFDSFGTWVAPSASSYTTGGYDPAAAAAGWPGGAYPGGVAPYSGSYTGPVGGTYDSATGTYSSASTWTQSSDGTWTSSSGGTAPSGDTSTSTSTSTSTDSGGSTDTSTSTDSGGSTDTSTSTGAVVSDEENKIVKENWFRSFWKKLFG